MINKNIVEDIVNAYYQQWLLTNDPYTSDVDFKDLVNVDMTLDINSNRWLLL